MDSDTCLETRCIEELKRPFTDPDVWSVAAIEMVLNQDHNWLTLLTTARAFSFQLLACAAQNAAGGEILVNRGACAMYRGSLLRDTLPAYLGETFMGRPIKLGDDAALTLFARMRGKAVQQPSAFAFTIHPQTLRHHLKQWTRWMRGSTIRTIWRLRYLPWSSYGLWYTVANTWTFLAGLGTIGACIAYWPASAVFTVTSLAAAAIWTTITSLRVLTIRRSDQSSWDRLALVTVAPVAALWMLLVLRPIRLYGIATCLRQGWVTRKRVEVVE
jgi:hyaluronan synthase